MKKITKITVKRVVDEHPDFSFLQQEYEGETKKNREKYKAQDRERLENYGRTWWSTGIYAVAELNVNNGNLPANNWQIHEVRSGGIWGIDSDYEQSDVESYKQAELADLKLTLKEFGFSDEEIDKVPIEHEDEA